MLRLQEEAKELDVPGRSTNKLSEMFRDQATIKGLFITLGLFGGQQLAGIFVMVRKYSHDCIRRSAFLY